VPAVSCALKLRDAAPSISVAAREDEDKPNASEIGHLGRSTPPGLLQAFKTPRLWSLGFWCMLVAAAMTGFASNIQPLVLDAGKTVVQATTATSLFFLGVVCGRLVMGVLLDRMSRYLLAILTFAISIGGALIMAGAPSLPFSIVLLGAVMLAVGQGAEADMMSYFVLKEFGRLKFATMFGAFIPIITAGALAGPYLFGWLRDKTGTYESSCYTCVFLFATAIVLVIRFRWSGRGDQDSRGNESELLSTLATQDKR
jgi:MFS family permease